MDRRSFIAGGTAAISLGAMPPAAGAEVLAEAPTYSTSNARWQNAYDKALAVLAANVQVMPYYSEPVLIEGASYRGIWQECGPHEALVYRKWRPDVARHSHLTFFDLQRADGQLPANNKLVETSFGQIQMVVPIAATAWELAEATGDGELLDAAYRGCAAWDGWLDRYRNTRGTGLVEGFCTYDTGHDNSPRWAGMPNQCPNKNARAHHPIASLPRLCPDLSATTYGARRALASMATALGKTAEADRWTERAETIRRAIIARLYVAADAAFYDLDAQDAFVRIRSDILTRVCGEHVPDQAMFDTLWTRQIHDPRAFWAPCPLPSIALDDPRFVRPIPANSWGGAAQALTALRAGRWFDHYNRASAFGVMMDRWCDAIQADPTMRQQVDPQNGAFTQADEPGYSPTSLVMVDYTWRLVGVREERDRLDWNIRPRHPAARDAMLAMPLDAGNMATIRYDRTGATLLPGKSLSMRVAGGSVRVSTDKQGKPISLLGIDPAPQHVTLSQNGRPTRSFLIQPDQRILID